MKLRLLDIVRCPACRGPLSLHSIEERTDPAGGHDPRYRTDVEEGVLCCLACTLAYPVTSGIPRLIRNAVHEFPEFYERHRELIGRLRGCDGLVRELERVDRSVYHRRSNASFAHQWQQHQSEDRTWFKDDLSLRREEFLTSLDVDAAALRGALVLDAGCGNGRLTAAIAGYGLEVVGMDLSRSVDQAHARRRDIAGSRAPYVHLVQANIMEPPFAPEAFDCVHTSGVLHHTPDTEQAFDSLLQLAAPRARVNVQLYRRREAWVGIPNRLIRAMTCRLPVPLLYRLCYLAVPAHTAIVSVIARARGERTPLHTATRRERAISMFDNYSPRYQHRFRPADVRRMFERRGLQGVKDVTLANERRHMVAFVGYRPERA
jgi:uncharacterized protein YbaR (Trm112 family)/SAM-dependent methyltransferase